MAHGNDAKVEILYAQGRDQGRICRVSDLRIGHIVHSFLGLMLVLVNDQDLMVHIGHFLGHVAAEAPQADQQNILHHYPPASS